MRAPRKKVSRASSSVSNDPTGMADFNSPWMTASRSSCELSLDKKLIRAGVQRRDVGLVLCGWR